ncbi:hypothetical protein [Fastidiosibacter lacustris]|uniref:hypothetical protein n=1 Tax=Fastidiosibacter lacustris TaxID=2056695 RepID=UPI000E342C1C|nr:hypothetical protein [Fastidiosibacter lacustris]
MKISKAKFGKMLANKLQETTDVVALSRWSYAIFLDCQREVEPNLRDLLLDLIRMEDAPEFEYSVEELRKLAQDLQNKR